VHEALGGAFPKRHHVDCGVIAIICKVPVLGRHKLSLKDGKLQIEDVQGPTGEGSLEARMEALEQEVFKYKKMAERKVDIIHRINQELTAKHKKETA
jgi:hypothetical protein